MPQGAMTDYPENNLVSDRQDGPIMLANRKRPKQAVWTVVNLAGILFKWTRRMVSTWRIGGHFQLNTHWTDLGQHAGFPRQAATPQS